MLDELEAQGHRIAPTFLFVDPFGLSGTPFRLVKRFLENRHCEVLINFQYQAINRFKSLLPDRLNELFGTERWRDVDNLAISPQQREDFLVSLYREKLGTVARWTWGFRMLDRHDKTTYHLVFATNSVDGLAKMKEAMWRISPTGDYSFSDRHAGQTVLFGPGADLSPLRSQLVDEFRGRTITIEEIERFVITKTDFLKSHVRRPLGVLEREGLVDVETERQREFTYPPGTRIRFLS